MLNGVCFLEGEQLRYRALAGDVYDADKLAENMDGTLLINVKFPGVRHPVMLNKIKLESKDG